VLIGYDRYRYERNRNTPIHDSETDAEQHQVGKDNTQKIESKHINLRTRIKRLVRRTICFSKTVTQKSVGEHYLDITTSTLAFRMKKLWIVRPWQAGGGG
jgi:hypothetical protein